MKKFDVRLPSIRMNGTNWYISSEFIFTRIILVMDNWLNNNWNIQLVTSSYLNFVLTVVSQLKCLFIQRNQLIATVTSDVLHNWCSIIKIKKSIDHAIWISTKIRFIIGYFFENHEKISKIFIELKKCFFQVISKCIL